MDSGCSWEQSSTLINELTQGMEFTRQLKYYLSSTSSSETRDLLMQRILSSYEKALLILRWSGTDVAHHVPALPPPPPTAGGLPESSISVEGSPRSEDFDKRVHKDHMDNRNATKKRRMQPTWTDQVKICSENGLEGPVDDGCSWRKYGQKDILGAKYPRSYYRCTYRGTQNCWATKQVQRSDEDPTVFEITYKGSHTCCQVNQSAPPASSSPEKQEDINHSPQPQNEMLSSLRANLRVNTENLDTKEDGFAFSSTGAAIMKKGASSVMQDPTIDNNHHMDSYSASFVSPATSELNHFSSSPIQMNGFGRALNLQNSDSDLTEIISANNSSTNSPIVDWDFSVYPVNIEQTFPFDIPGFFS